MTGDPSCPVTASRPREFLFFVRQHPTSWSTIPQLHKQQSEAAQINKFVSCRRETRTNRPHLRHPQFPVNLKQLDIQSSWYPPLDLKSPAEHHHPAKSWSCLQILRKCILLLSADQAWVFFYDARSLAIWGPKEARSNKLLRDSKSSNVSNAKQLPSPSSHLVFQIFTTVLLLLNYLSVVRTVLILLPSSAEKVIIINKVVRQWSQPDLQPLLAVCQFRQFLQMAAEMENGSIRMRELRA